MRPVHGYSRELQGELTPLFADEYGLPYTHSVMDTLLHSALVRLYGEQVASCHSWHSLRSGLATALKAAGCSDEVIQMICRWANPESLKVYAFHSTTHRFTSTGSTEPSTVTKALRSPCSSPCTTLAGGKMSFHSRKNANDGEHVGKGTAGRYPFAPPFAFQQKPKPPNPHPSIHASIHGSRVVTCWGVDPQSPPTPVGKAGFEAWVLTKGGLVCINTADRYHTVWSHHLYGKYDTPIAVRGGTLRN